MEAAKAKFQGKYERVESKLLVETKAMQGKQRSKFDSKEEAGNIGHSFGG